MTREELEQAWKTGPAPPTEHGVVRLLVVRTGGGAHETPDAVRVTAEGGIEGDRWSAEKDPARDSQVTLMNARAVELLCGDSLPHHLPGDNFVVDFDVSEGALPAGSRVQLGEVVLETTAHPHLGCGKFRDRFGDAKVRWVNDKGHRERRLRGVNCRVVSGGRVSVGDAVSSLCT